jgi:SPP1 family predicted phage head-tail adaptor
MPNFMYKIDVWPPDADGQPNTATPVASGLLAEVEDLAGRRLEQAQLSNVETTHMFKVWYTPAITFDCFISFAAAIYAIDYILDKGKPVRNMYMELYAHRIDCPR